MYYLIKHDPTGLFVNIAFGTYDALNLGFKPRIYSSKSLAESDLLSIPDILDVDIKRAKRGIDTFTRRHLTPLLEKNAVKVNATRTKYIQFYENKIESIRKELERFEQIQKGTFYMVEIEEDDLVILLKQYGLAESYGTRV